MTSPIYTLFMRDHTEADDFRAYRQMLIAQAKQADLLSVVQAYTPLKRTGSLWSGRCPFHADTKETGHFFVQNNNRCICYYAGCPQQGQSMDTLAFVQAVEGVSFDEAVLLLNDLPVLSDTPRASRPIPAFVPPPPVPTLIGTVITEGDCIHWHEQLLSHTELLGWLDKRGVPRDAVVEGYLGFTGDDDKLDKVVYDDDKTLWWVKNRLSIPWIKNGELTGVKLRRSPFADKGEKYLSIPHAIDMGYLYGSDDLCPETHTAILVESEYDRWLLKYILEYKHCGGGGYPVVMLSKPAHGFTAESLLPLSFVNRIIYLHDFDQPDKTGKRAGSESAVKFRSLLSRAECYAPPKGKDVGEFYLTDEAGCITWLNRIIMNTL